MTDITLWIILTDLTPQQHCAAMVLKLGGAAREVGRTLTPQELLIGGVVEGQQVDPVSYLLVALHRRFAALEE